MTSNCFTKWACTPCDKNFLVLKNFHLVHISNFVRSNLGVYIVSEFISKLASWVVKQWEKDEFLSASQIFLLKPPLGYAKKRCFGLNFFINSMLWLISKMSSVIFKNLKSLEVNPCPPINILQWKHYLFPTRKS